MWGGDRRYLRSAGGRSGVDELLEGEHCSPFKGSEVSAERAGGVGDQAAVDLVALVDRVINGVISGSQPCGRCAHADDEVGSEGLIGDNAVLQTSIATAHVFDGVHDVGCAVLNGGKLRVDLVAGKRRRGISGLEVAEVVRRGVWDGI